MEEAIAKVIVMQADLGGTEILKPMQHIYRQNVIPGHTRQMFVFTDGGVWNTKEILDLVRTHSRSHRCFTFGIGQGASTALITGMAKEGRGIAQFITGNERLQPKVDSAVWATVLALIWLHGFRMAEQEKSKFIAMKATSWICSQKVESLTECIQAGNALLECQVREQDLGLDHQNGSTKL